MFNQKIKEKNVRDVCNKMYTIDDLKKEQKNVYKPCRDRPKICVLDDKGFPYLSILNNEGYKDITEVKYYTKIEDFENYDVILCDLDGVGIEHHRKEQGAAIAKDLYKFYPFKKIFIYTGNIISDFAKDVPSDIKYIPKQSDPIEITNILDEACSYLWNPQKTWIFFENVLRKEKICNKNIAYIEHIFVRSFLEDKNYFESEKNYLDVILKSAQVVEILSNIVLGIIGVIK